MKAVDPSDNQTVPSRTAIQGPRKAACLALSLIAMLAAILALPGNANAQAGQLPCATVGTALLNEEQRLAIRDYANAASRDAESDDQEASQRGIRALLQPFACTTVSSAFRLEYSRILSDRLNTWARGEDPRRAWLAMLIAGRCGTDLVEGVLRDGLRDERTAVRGAAAIGIRDALAGIAAGQDGLRPDRGNQLANLAFERLGQETDPIVAEQLANIFSALQPNPDLQVQHFSGFAAGVASSIQLARRSAADRVQPLVPAQPGLDDAASRDRLILLERSLDRVRVSLVTPRVRDNLRNSDIAAAGLLAGQALAYLRDELAAQRIAPDRVAPAERSLERAAEVLGITGGRLGVTLAQADGPQLVAAFRASRDAGNADAFIEVADLWIGQGGRLVGGVFGGRSEAFQPTN